MKQRQRDELTDMKPIEGGLPRRAESYGKWQGSSSTVNSLASPMAIGVGDSHPAANFGRFNSWHSAIGYLVLALVSKRQQLDLADAPSRPRSVMCQRHEAARPGIISYSVIPHQTML
jgi:hypothetical protein